MPNSINLYPTLSDSELEWYINHHSSLINTEVAYRTSKDPDKINEHFILTHTKLLNAFKALAAYRALNKCEN